MSFPSSAEIETIDIVSKRKKNVFQMLLHIYPYSSPNPSRVRFGMVIVDDNIDITMKAMIMHLDGFLAEAIPTPPAIVGNMLIII